MARHERNRPVVITDCIADYNSATGERIVEFSDRQLGVGGLISFRRLNGALRVEVYRTDPGVVVIAPANPNVRE